MINSNIVYTNNIIIDGQIIGENKSIDKKVRIDTNELHCEELNVSKIGINKLIDVDSETSDEIKVLNDNKNYLVVGDYECKEIAIDCFNKVWCMMNDYIIIFNKDCSLFKKVNGNYEHIIRQQDVMITSNTKTLTYWNLDGTINKVEEKEYVINKMRTYEDDLLIISNNSFHIINNNDTNYDYTIDDITENEFGVFVIILPKIYVVDIVLTELFELPNNCEYVKHLIVGDYIIFQTIKDNVSYFISFFTSLNKSYDLQLNYKIDADNYDVYEDMLIINNSVYSNDLCLIMNNTIATINYDVKCDKYYWKDNTLTHQSLNINNAMIRNLDDNICNTFVVNYNGDTVVSTYSKLYVFHNKKYIKTINYEISSELSFMKVCDNNLWLGIGNKSSGVKCIIMNNNYEIIKRLRLDIGEDETKYFARCVCKYNDEYVIGLDKSDSSYTTHNNPLLLRVSADYQAITVVNNKSNYCISCNDLLPTVNGLVAAFTQNISSTIEIVKLYTNGFSILQNCVSNEYYDCSKLCLLNDKIYAFINDDNNSCCVCNRYVYQNNNYECDSNIKTLTGVFKDAMVFNNNTYAIYQNNNKANCVRINFDNTTSSFNIALNNNCSSITCNDNIIISFVNSTDKCLLMITDDVVITADPFSVFLTSSDTDINAITAYTTDTNNNLIFSCDNLSIDESNYKAMLVIYDSNLKFIKRINTPTFTDIRSIVCDRKGNIWVCCNYKEEWSGYHYLPKGMCVYIYNNIYELVATIKKEKVYAEGMYLLHDNIYIYDEDNNAYIYNDSVQLIKTIKRLQYYSYDSDSFNHYYGYIDAITTIAMYDTDELQITDAIDREIYYTKIANFVCINKYNMPIFNSYDGVIDASMNFITSFVYNEKYRALLLPSSNNYIMCTDKNNILICDQFLNIIYEYDFTMALMCNLFNKTVLQDGLNIAALAKYVYTNKQLQIVDNSVLTDKIIEGDKLMRYPVIGSSIIIRRSNMGDSDWHNRCYCFINIPYSYDTNYPVLTFYVNNNVIQNDFIHTTYEETFNNCYSITAATTGHRFPKTDHIIVSLKKQDSDSSLYMCDLYNNSYDPYEIEYELPEITDGNSYKNATDIAYSNLWVSGKDVYFYLIGWDMINNYCSDSNLLIIRMNNKYVIESQIHLQNDYYTSGSYPNVIFNDYIYKKVDDEVLGGEFYFIGYETDELKETQLVSYYNATELEKATSTIESTKIEFKQYAKSVMFFAGLNDGFTDLVIGWHTDLTHESKPSLITIFDIVKDTTGSTGIKINPIPIVKINPKFNASKATAATVINYYHWFSYCSDTPDYNSKVEVYDDNYEYIGSPQYPFDTPYNGIISLQGLSDTIILASWYAENNYPQIVIYDRNMHFTSIINQTTIPKQVNLDPTPYGSDILIDKDDRICFNTSTRTFNKFIEREKVNNVAIPDLKYQSASTTDNVYETPLFNYKITQDSITLQSHLTENKSGDVITQVSKKYNKQFELYPHYSDFIEFNNLMIISYNTKTPNIFIYDNFKLAKVISDADDYCLSIAKYNNYLFAVFRNTIRIYNDSFECIGSYNKNATKIITGSTDDHIYLIEDNEMISYLFNKHELVKDASIIKFNKVVKNVYVNSTSIYFVLAGANTNEVIIVNSNNKTTEYLISNVIGVFTDYDNCYVINYETDGYYLTSFSYIDSEIIKTSQFLISSLGENKELRYLGYCMSIIYGDFIYFCCNDNSVGDNSQDVNVVFKFDKKMKFINILDFYTDKIAEDIIYNKDEVITNSINVNKLMIKNKEAEVGDKQITYDGITYAAKSLDELVDILVNGHAHNFINFTSQQHECSICGINNHTFVNGKCKICKYLCTHNYEYTNTQHTCTICNYSEQHNLISSQLESHCTVCSFVCNHQTSISINKTNHKCSSCNYVIQHTFVDNNSIRTCSGCNFKCETHNYEYVDDNKHKCTLCDYETTHIGSINYDHKCACGIYVNVDSSNNPIHINESIDDNNHKCYYCSLINNHNIKIRDNDTHYCSICNFEKQHSYVCDTTEETNESLTTHTCSVCNNNETHNYLYTSDIDELIHTCSKCELSEAHKFKSIDIEGGKDSLNHKCSICGKESQHNKLCNENEKTAYTSSKYHNCKYCDYYEEHDKYVGEDRLFKVVPDGTNQRYHRCDTCGRERIWCNIVQYEEETDKTLITDSEGTRYKLTNYDTRCVCNFCRYYKYHSIDHSVDDTYHYCVNCGNVKHRFYSDGMYHICGMTQSEKDADIGIEYMSFKCNYRALHTKKKGSKPDEDGYVVCSVCNLKYRDLSSIKAGLDVYDNYVITYSVPIGYEDGVLQYKEYAYTTTATTSGDKKVLIIDNIYYSYDAETHNIISEDDEDLTNLKQFITNTNCFLIKNIGAIFNNDSIIFVSVKTEDNKLVIDNEYFRLENYKPIYKDNHYTAGQFSSVEFNFGYTDNNEIIKVYSASDDAFKPKVDARYVEGDLIEIFVSMMLSNCIFNVRVEGETELVISDGQVIGYLDDNVVEITKDDFDYRIFTTNEIVSVQIYSDPTTITTDAIHTEFTDSYLTDGLYSIQASHIIISSFTTTTNEDNTTTTVKYLMERPVIRTNNNYYIVDHWLNTRNLDAMLYEQPLHILGNGNIAIGDSARTQLFDKTYYGSMLITKQLALCPYDGSSYPAEGVETIPVNIEYHDGYLFSMWGGGYTNDIGTSRCGYFCETINIKKNYSFDPNIKVDYDNWKGVPLSDYLNNNITLTPNVIFRKNDTYTVWSFNNSLTDDPNIREIELEYTEEETWNTMKCWCYLCAIKNNRIFYFASRVNAGNFLICKNLVNDSSTDLSVYDLTGETLTLSNHSHNFVYNNESTHKCDYEDNTRKCNYVAEHNITYDNDYHWCTICNYEKCKHTFSSGSTKCSGCYFYCGYNAPHSFKQQTDEEGQLIDKFACEKCNYVCEHKTFAPIEIDESGNFIIKCTCGHIHNYTYTSTSYCACSKCNRTASHNYICECKSNKIHLDKAYGDELFKSDECIKMDDINDHMHHICKYCGYTADHYSSSSYKFKELSSDNKYTNYLHYCPKCSIKYEHTLTKSNNYSHICSDCTYYVNHTYEYVDESSHKCSNVLCNRIESEHSLTGKDGNNHYCGKCKGCESPHSFEIDSSYDEKHRCNVCGSRYDCEFIDDVCIKCGYERHTHHYVKDRSSSYKHRCDKIFSNNQQCPRTGWCNIKYKDEQSCGCEVCDRVQNHKIGRIETTASYSSPITYSHYCTECDYIFNQDCKDTNDYGIYTGNGYTCDSHHKCNVCGTTYEHSYVIKCSKCGIEYSDNVSNGCVHEFIATCSADGYVCNHKTYINGSGYVTLAPSYVTYKKDDTYHTCRNCSMDLKHNFTDVCTECGYYEDCPHEWVNKYTAWCSICGGNTYCNHTYDDNICSKCGAKYGCSHNWYDDVCNKCGGRYSHIHTYEEMCSECKLAKP